jgi:hypothetical protein
VGRQKLRKNRKAIKIINKNVEKEGLKARKPKPSRWAPKMIRPGMLYGQKTTTPTLYNNIYILETE